jgi:hypothetical protein
LTEIYNKAGVVYVEEVSDGTSQGQQTNQKGNTVAKIERLSNTVTTDVIHLYLNVKKLIQKTESSVADASQTFLFKVERYNSPNDILAGKEPEEIFYTTINNCTTEETISNDTYYVGNQLVQLDKRGYYMVSEVASWSKTDYDYVTGYSTTDVDWDDYDATPQTQGVVVDISQKTLTGGAFYTAIGTVLSSTTQLNTIYNTFITTFTNQESEYAYLSGQAYAKNAFKFKAENTIE